MEESGDDDDDNDDKRWWEAEEPSRIGVGLPKLKVTRAMCGDGRTTKSVKFLAYVSQSSKLTGKKTDLQRMGQA